MVSKMENVWNLPIREQSRGTADIRAKNNSMQTIETENNGL